MARKTKATLEPDGPMILFGATIETVRGLDLLELRVGKDFAHAEKIRAGTSKPRTIRILFSAGQAADLAAVLARDPSLYPDPDQRLN